MTTSINQKKITVAIVAGEVSGDILAAGLIQSLQKSYPNIHFVGIAGPKMKALGCEPWYDMEELSVMGIVEVLGKLKRILSIRRDITKRIKALKPDVFIGVDAPDFNLTLEGSLKKVGIKTVHYVSPSVWVWKQKRVFKIKKNTDLMLSFLPFEKDFYDKYGVPCQFIGHKMADDIPLSPDAAAVRQKLNIQNDANVLALLPGSRHAEVSLLSEPFIKAAQIVSKHIPNLHVLVPLVNQKRRQEFELIKNKIAPDFKMQLLDGMARDAMIASNATILASGTATLECMLAKSPMVVAYKMNKLTYWIVKKLAAKTPYVALPNILAGREIVPELLQDNCYTNNIVNHVLPLFNKDNSKLKDTFLTLHKQIKCDADKQAAKAVLELIHGSK